MPILLIKNISLQHLHTVVLLSLYIRLVKLTRTFTSFVCCTKQSRNCDVWMSTTKPCLSQRKALSKPRPIVQGTTTREWSGQLTKKSPTYLSAVYCENTDTSTPANFEYIRPWEMLLPITLPHSRRQSNGRQGDQRVP